MTRIKVAKKKLRLGITKIEDVKKKNEDRYLDNKVDQEIF